MRCIMARASELKRDREAESSRAPMRTGGRIRRSRAQASTANDDVDGEKLPDRRPQSSASMSNTTFAGAQKIRVNIDEAGRPKAARAYGHGRANTILGSECPRAERQPYSPAHIDAVLCSSVCHLVLAVHHRECVRLLLLSSLALSRSEHSRMTNSVARSNHD